MSQRHNNIFRKRSHAIILQWADGDFAMSMWVRPQFRAVARQVERIMPIALTGIATALALSGLLPTP